MGPALEDRLAPLRRGPSATAAYEILALRHGTCTTSRAHCFLGHERRGEPDAPVRMDFFLWALRSGQRTIVVDTGFGAQAALRRGRTALRAPGQALAQVGIDPRDVEQLVLTHLHYDHAGNIDAFPRASIDVNADELAFWRGPLAARGEFAALVEARDLRELDAAEQAGRVSICAGDALLAPGVLALWTGGHTPGHRIVAVRGRAGLVVLAADAVHFYEELERDTPFAIFSDLCAVYAAYDLLAELERDGATVVAGHDPRVLTRFPTVDGLPSETAVVVG